MTLIDILNQYRDSGIYPMHMPGHKRNSLLMPKIDPYGIDLTEIEGFDSLHDAEGLLFEGMERAAVLYGSKRTFYLVNGSSCGILAAVAACTQKGEKVLVARNSHKSIYNAINLLELNAVYLQPSQDTSFGISTSITPASVEKELQEHNDIRLIIITSPTYEGVISDIESIAILAHRKKIPLIVDEAHGSHLGFSPAFPQNSVSAGADIIIHGLHKTMPSPTQTALLHVNGELVDPEGVRRQLSVFESSSPSYVLMAGIDYCVTMIAGRGEKLFKEYSELLEIFNEKMRHLKSLKVLCKGKDLLYMHPMIFAYDPGKIVVSVRNTSMTGRELAEELLLKFSIQTEMAMGDYTLAMTSIADTVEGFDRLSSALLNIDMALPNVTITDRIDSIYPLPETSIPIFRALSAPSRFVPLEQSIGCVSHEYVYAYPPGVPLLVPGDIISENVLDTISRLFRQSVTLKSTYGRMPNEISIV